MQEDRLRALQAHHAPTAAALRSLATVAVLETELEHPQASGVLKQTVAEQKLAAALTGIYAAYHANPGHRVDLLEPHEVAPYQPEAVRWAVDAFNLLHLFGGRT